MPRIRFKCPDCNEENSYILRNNCRRCKAGMPHNLLTCLRCGHYNPKRIRTHCVHCNYFFGYFYLPGHNTCDRNYTQGRFLQCRLATQNYEECSICLGEIIQGAKIHTVPCGHTFHYDCIVPWSQINQNCPVCRRRLHYIHPAVVVIHWNRQLQQLDSANKINVMHIDVLFSHHSWNKTVSFSWLRVSPFG